MIQLKGSFNNKSVQSLMFTTHCRHREVDHDAGTVVVAGVAGVGVVVVGGVAGIVVAAAAVDTAVGLAHHSAGMKGAVQEGAQTRPAY